MNSLPRFEAYNWKEIDIYYDFTYVPQDLVNGVEVINEEPVDYITHENNKNYYNW